MDDVCLSLAGDAPNRHQRTSSDEDPTFVPPCVARFGVKMLHLDTPQKTAAVISRWPCCSESIRVLEGLMKNKPSIIMCALLISVLCLLSLLLFLSDSLS